MLSECFFKEAANVFKASRLELICARLFGKKRTATDGDTTVIFLEWRGNLYLIDMKEPANETSPL